MKPSRALQRFLLALGAGAILAAAGATALTVALGRHSVAEQAHTEAERERTAILNRLLQAQRDEPEILRAIARFEALKREGVIGAERRLEWAEQVARVKTAYRIAPFDFELAPRRRLDAAGDPLALHASTMTLRAQLLHEGDLLRVLAAIRRLGRAEILPRRCSAERLQASAAPAAADPGPAPTLQIQCELDWITLSLNPGPQP